MMRTWKYIFLLVFFGCFATHGFAQSVAEDAIISSQIAQLPSVTSKLATQRISQTLSIESIGNLIVYERNLENLTFFENHKDVFQRVRVLKWNPSIENSAFSGDYSVFYNNLQMQTLTSPEYIVEYKINGDVFASKYESTAGFAKKVNEMNGDPEKSEPKILTSKKEFLILSIYSKEPIIAIENEEMFREYRGAISVNAVSDGDDWVVSSLQPIVSAIDLGFYFMITTLVRPDPLWPSIMRHPNATLDSVIGEIKLPGKGEKIQSLTVRDVMLLPEDIRIQHFNSFYKHLYGIQRLGEINRMDQALGVKRKRGENDQGMNELSEIPLPKFYRYKDQYDSRQPHELVKNADEEYRDLENFFIHIRSSKNHDDLRSLTEDDVDLSRVEKDTQIEKLIRWFDYLQELRDENPEAAGAKAKSFKKTI